ncbi:MAG: nicotinate (nicotinamide) nucleotide adenylyltransferase [Mariprofundaceae bacterium]|nr:nicotinate (nicotinamide) nucleotide adenylyltransferase [Mariprofundaceae bacterium]
MKKIAVFGGSFDPPHLGHHALVTYAQHVLALDEVWVIPVGQAVHRSLTASISADQRLHWVQALFEDVLAVKVLDWEVNACCPTPSIESMQRIANTLDVVPYWLMGMDAWQGMPTWVGYPKHQSLCHVVVVNREGEQACHHQEWRVVASPSKPCAGCVSYIQDAPPNISASQIRQAILTGQDVSTVLDAKKSNEICAAYGACDVNRGQE